jgi:hypothetical protein
MASARCHGSAKKRPHHLEPPLPQNLQLSKEHKKPKFAIDAGSFAATQSIPRK